MIRAEEAQAPFLPPTKEVAASVRRVINGVVDELGVSGPMSFGDMCEYRSLLCFTPAVTDYFSKGLHKAAKTRKVVKSKEDAKWNSFGFSPVASD